MYIGLLDCSWSVLTVNNNNGFSRLVAFCPDPVNLIFLPSRRRRCRFLVTWGREDVALTRARARDSATDCQYCVPTIITYIPRQLYRLRRICTATNPLLQISLWLCWKETHSPLFWNMYSTRYYYCWQIQDFQLWTINWWGHGCWSLILITQLPASGLLAVGVFQQPIGQLIAVTLVHWYSWYWVQWLNCKPREWSSCGWKWKS